METEKDMPVPAEEDPVQPTLEEGFARLDQLMEVLSDPQIPLEDAFGAYREGMKLLRECEERIDLVEKKVRILNGEAGPEDVQDEF